MVKIKSYVGGHSVKVYTNCEYDSNLRKYKGGELLTEVPYSGRMLNAKVKQEPAESVMVNGVEIPTSTPQIFVDVDDIPPESECDYCVVSALYVAACKALGRDTGRLLTIGGVVVNEDNMTIGTIGFNRN